LAGQEACKKQNLSIRHRRILAVWPAFRTDSIDDFNNLWLISALQFELDGSRPKNGADNHIGGFVVRYAVSVFLVMTCLGAASAVAEPALGTWATEPDRKGQIGHVQVRSTTQVTQT